MGTAAITTLEDRVSGDNTPVLNAIHGSAKAWVHFNQSTFAVNDSYGVDSVTDNAAGNFTVNFTTPFASAYYAWNCSHTLYNRGSQAVNLFSQAAGALNLRTNYESSPDTNTRADSSNVNVEINNVNT